MGMDAVGVEGSVDVAAVGPVVGSVVGSVGGTERQTDGRTDREKYIPFPKHNDERGKDTPL